MEGQFIEFVENEKLVARFPNFQRYRNPFGYMQGGIIAAAIDNTASTLGYIVGQPSITESIAVTYKRPVRKSDKYIKVTATVLDKTKKGIKLKAEVANENNKLTAFGIVNCVFIKGHR